MPKTSPQLPNPRGFSPLRRAASIRRTSSVDATWPNGRQANIKLHGIARDVITPLQGNSPEILQLDEITVEVGLDKNILHINATPKRIALQQLLGVHAFGELRSQMDSLLAQDKTQGAPLYQLVTDITGCLIASDWAWASRKESQRPEPRARRRDMLSKMEGICIGFRPSSSALYTDGNYQANMAASVPPLPNPKDPKGWHQLPIITDEVSFRRARRLDIWLDGDIYIESTFQDSATTEEGGRLAVHEYTVCATFDRSHLRLQKIEATPHILPFLECPAAMDNIQQLVGVTAQNLRTEVSRKLRKVKGCTHLNDAVRALAEAPVLIKQLISVLNAPI